MDLIGKTTIHPFIFYTGKIAGYISWIIYLLSIIGVNIIDNVTSVYQLYASYIAGIIGLVLIVLSSIGLGKSIRLGLPKEDTVLKTTGIYQFSRNPMYLGFNLWTIASIIYTFNIYIILLGLYSIWVYHMIIRGEENFLEDRFGSAFIDYKKKARKYF
jgi:protein-S-isoprenylcysteine O-methyltransferase Ste14